MTSARWASGPSSTSSPLDHLELGQRHGWIEMEAAAEASGSRFAYLLGDLVMVELALVRFAMELVRAEGFEPAIPPVLVREQALYGTGFFPGEREMIYEVPARRALPGRHLGGLARLAARRTRSWPPASCRSATPASPPAFAARPGAAGRDTRGIFRVHQFDKVEMFSFVRARGAQPRGARARSSRSRSGSSRALEIPYRVVDIAVGDLGASAARKFDCEGWIPSQERFRELTSCSNTTDYQARRLSSRYRPGARRIPRTRAHAERNGGGCGSNAYRAAGERSDGRRDGGIPQCFAGIWLLHESIPT